MPTNNRTAAKRIINTRIVYSPQFIGAFVNYTGLIKLYIRNKIR